MTRFEQAQADRDLALERVADAARDVANSGGENGDPRSWYLVDPTAMDLLRAAIADLASAEGHLGRCMVSAFAADDDDDAPVTP